MVCSKCGAQISDTAKFCEECGAPIVKDASPIKPESQKDGCEDVKVSKTAKEDPNTSLPVSDNTLNAKKKNSRTKTILILAVVLIVGCVIGYKIYRSYLVGLSDELEETLESRFQSTVDDFNASNPYISDLRFSVDIWDVHSIHKVTCTYSFFSFDFEDCTALEKWDIMHELYATFSATDTGDIKNDDFGNPTMYGDVRHGGGEFHTYYLIDEKLIMDHGTVIVDNGEIVPISNNSSSSDSYPNYRIVSDEDDEYWYAVSTAQELVKDELKSPSTAKFSFDTSDYTVQRSGDQWKISGYVDAQNGFGATLREYWTATFTMGDISGSKYEVSNYSVTFS